MTRLHVAGVALRGSGYPNAAQTIRALEADPAWQVEDRADWLPEGVHLWRIARGPLGQRLALAIRLVVGNALALLHLKLALRQRPALVYVPYPAAFLLWWVSWLPQAWRPRIIADAYISLWDSAFRDRAHGSRLGQGIAGRLAKAFERRALRAAAVVLVDTVANEQFMVAEFGLQAARVRSVPLAIDVAAFIYEPLRSAPEPVASLRVMFVGTLIPLHGIRVIAETARLAGPDAGMVFHVVGDGQDSATLDALMADGNRAPVVWERGWMGLDEIARRMAQADVCLGVFGGEGKAGRVLPFKLYMGLAAGKAIVTQDRYSLPAGLPPPPVKTVAPEPVALLRALRQLKSDSEGRCALASEGAEYYRRWLGPVALRRAWQEIAASGGNIG